MARLEGLDKIFRNLDQLKDNVRQNTAQAMEIFGANMEVQAKGNAPWTDRTGNARRSISSETEASVNKIETYLSIGVFYGKYLELSNGGKYAIVWATITQNRQAFANALRMGFKL